MASATSGSTLLLHNLADVPVTVNIGPQGSMTVRPSVLLVDGLYSPPTRELTELQLHGWGDRWIRLCRSDGT